MRGENEPSRGAPKGEAGGVSRRGLVATLGSAAGLGLAGCSSITGTPAGTPESPTGTATEETSGTPTDGGDAGNAGVVATAPVPRTDTEYALMGRADTPETATLYGGWKCPYTRDFVRGMFRDVVRDYVDPGRLTVEFRAVRFQADEPHGTDEPRSNRAGLAVWHTDPEQFWPYVAHVFSVQPPETEEWATTERLVAFAREAGVEDTRAVERAAEGDQYDDLWQGTMEVIEEKSIRGIPRFELGGDITAPTIDPDATRAQLDRTFE